MAATFKVIFMGDLKLRNTGNPVLLQKDALFFFNFIFPFWFFVPVS